MIGEGLVVGLEELEGFRDAGECGGCRPDDILELLEGCHFVLEEPLAVAVDLLLELLVLDALGRGMGTRSSSCFCSFFFASFLGAVSVIV